MEDPDNSKSSLKKPILGNQTFQSDSEEDDDSVLQQDLNTMNRKSTQNSGTQGTEELTLADLDSESGSSTSSRLSETSDEDYNPEPNRFGYEAKRAIQKFKILAKEDIEILTQEYRADTYNFKIVGSAFYKRMTEQGIVNPDPEAPLPLVYELYLEAIKNILKLCAIYMFLHGTPIYTIALINQNVGIFKIIFSKDVFKLMFTPYTFVKTSKLFFLIDLVINPLILIIMTGLFIRELLKFEKRIVDSLKGSKEINMFKCVRLKHLEIQNSEILEK